MRDLKQADLRQAFRFLGEAAAVDGDEPFSPDVLAAFQRLVPCGYVFFSELDREREVALAVAGHPVWREPDPPVDYWQIRDEHPLCSYHELTCDWRAHKLTDFVTQREFRRRRIYLEWFRPCGVEHELSVGLDSPRSHTKVFLFVRGPGSDFDERDKTVLNLLRPHLGRLYRSALTRRRLRGALAALEEEAGAVVLLDGDDRVVHATPGALALLARHCGSSGSALPEQVRAWLTDVRDAGTQKPLVVETDGGTLVVRTVGEFLLLEGRPRDERLTRRERQIMELVAAGKTNAKIATILCLAPGTVRRHLQNVYAKLGVHNRTSAVAWLRASSRGTSLPAATPGESSGL